MLAGALRDGVFERRVGRSYSGKAVALVFHARLSLRRYLELTRHCQPPRRSILATTVISIKLFSPDKEKVLPARTVGVVLLALHFDQARDRAPELERAVAGGINFFRRHFGRDDQQRARLVERVDQNAEAARLV